MTNGIFFSATLLYKSLIFNFKFLTLINSAFNLDSLI